MFSMKPSLTPDLDSFKKLVEKKARCEDDVYLVGVRGYFLNTMGKTGQNDRGIYDDAIGIVSIDGLFTYNANVDPASYKKGIASLREGTWIYKQGIHGLSKPKPQQYQAYVQASDVTVDRDGQGSETGYFGINIHRGRTLSVSSLGCQTIIPSQWDAFNGNVKMLMKKYAQKTIRYILVKA